MSNSLKPTYQEIWKYLSDELAPESCVKIENWLDKSLENQKYFHQVLIDFNKFHLKEKPLPHKQKNVFYYWAASIAILLTVAGIIYLKGYEEPKTLYLADGTEVTILKGRLLNYDSMQFAHSGHLQIDGKVHITMPYDSKEPISVETKSGFYIIENADVIIESLESTQSSLKLFSGKAELLYPDANVSNVELLTGETIIYNSKHKTINKKHDEEAI